MSDEAENVMLGIGHYYYDRVGGVSLNRQWRGILGFSLSV